MFRRLKKKEKKQAGVAELEAKVAGLEQKLAEANAEAKVAPWPGELENLGAYKYPRACKKSQKKIPQAYQDPCAYEYRTLVDAAYL